MKKIILFSMFFIGVNVLLNGQNVGFKWAKSIGGKKEDIGKSVAVDKWKNVYTTGYFNDSADFDPDTGTYTLSASIQNLFLKFT